MNHLCADIADPAGFTLPAGYDTIQPYIGERVPIRTPTPHIWTKQDWARFPSARKYPMFVGTPAIGAAGDPVTEAFECLRALWEHRRRPGSAVGLDMETAIDSLYVTRFNGVLGYYGYHVIVYGSTSTVFDNPPCSGYDVADYQGTPFMYSHPFVRMTQYADAAQTGGGYDARLIKPWTWHTRLHR